MREDVFEGRSCKCGNMKSGGFERVKRIEKRGGTDFLCRCKMCGEEFVVIFSREIER